MIDGVRHASRFLELLNVDLLLVEVASGNGLDGDSVSSRFKCLLIMSIKVNWKESFSTFGKVILIKLNLFLILVKFVWTQSLYIQVGYCRPN